MDKGKNPIQEEEDFLSLVDDNQSNMMLSPQPMAPPEFSILSLSEGSGLAKESLLLDEMEAAKEDFFSKFLSMNFADSIKISEQYSLLPMDQLSDKADPLVPLPPRPALPPAPSPAKKDKPIVFRKAMPPQKLAEVALFDPKRAKRIVTNRLSAIRAKEKKKLYMFMLEHKLQTLQSKSAKLTARLTLLQTESNALKAQNLVLKDQMDIMTKRIQLQDSLNDQIRMEIQHMKTVLRQIAPNFKTSSAYSESRNRAINWAYFKTSATQHQVQNPYQEQQVQRDFQQRQPYEGGESSQIHQQLQEPNPQPHDHCQVQNDQVQSHHLQQAEETAAATL